MITFYPRDIGLWRQDFSFTDVENSADVKPKSKECVDYSEFLAFLESCGVRLDDPEFPLTIVDSEEASFVRKIPGLQSVIQWSLIGWIKII